MLLFCGTSFLTLTGGIKIEKVAVNEHFGNNVVIVILLKMGIEYPFAHSLPHN